MDDVERTRAGTAPPRTTPGQLRDFVRRFEPYEFLTLVGRAALQEGQNTRLGRIYVTRPDARSRTLSQFVLADVANFIIRGAAVHRSRLPTEDDLVTAANIVNGLEDPIPESSSRELEDWGVFLMRLGAKQFPLQVDVGPRIARMLTLFLDLPPLVPRTTYQFAERFEQVTGVTVEQFAWVTFTIWGSVQDSPVLAVRPLAQHGSEALRPFVNEATLSKTLRFLGRPLSEAKAAADREVAASSDQRLEHWAFNPLYQRPLIRLFGPEERYIAPVPRLLLERLVEAPYWILQEADGLDFMTAFGPVFEAYVGWVLEPALGTRLHAEETLGGVRTPDWRVDGPTSFGLLECKSGRLHKLAKTISTNEEVVEAMKHYGDAARQLGRFIGRVATNPALTEFATKPLLPLIVLLEQVALCNAPLFEPIRRRAREVAGADLDFDPQVCSVRAVEMLASVLEKHSFESVMAAKLVGEKRDWDWDTFLASDYKADVEVPARLKERLDAFWGTVRIRET